MSQFISTQNNLNWRIISIIMVILCAPFVGYAVIPLVDKAQIWALSLLGILLLIGILTALSITPLTDQYLFHPFYLVGATYIIGFLLPAIYIIFGRYDLFRGFSQSDGPTYLWQTLLLTTMALFCVLLGYKHPLGGKLGQKLYRFNTEIKETRLLVIFLIYLGIGLFIYQQFIKSSGGLTISLDELTTKRRSDLLFLRTIGASLINTASFLGFIYFAKVRRNVLFLLPLLISFAMPLLNSSRTELIVVLLNVLVLYHHLIRRITLQRNAVIGIVFILISMFILSQRNLKEFNSSRFYEFLNIDTIVEELMGRNSNNLSTVGQIIRYVDVDFNLLKGQMVTSLFIRFIPRAIWPDKPEGIGLQVSQLLYNERGDDSGVNPTLLGELFWNFHIPGVIFGMLLLGIFLRTIYEYLRHAWSNPWTVMIYSITLCYIFNQQRVFFAAAVMSYLFLLGPIIIAIWYASKPVVQSRSLI